MQTNMDENKIRYSKKFSEAIPWEIEQAKKQGWKIDVDGDEQVVYFTKEVENGKDI